MCTLCTAWGRFQQNFKSCGRDILLCGSRHIFCLLLVSQGVGVGAKVAPREVAQLKETFLERGSGATDVLRWVHYGDVLERTPRCKRPLSLVGENRNKKTRSQVSVLLMTYLRGARTDPPARATQPDRAPKQSRHVTTAPSGLIQTLHTVPPRGHIPVWI